MNAVSPGQGDILRGMQVEALPLRLARRAAPPALPAAAAAGHEDTGEPDDAAARERLEQAQREGREAGVRAGYEEGLRRGLADAQARARSELEQAMQQALAPLDDERKRLAALLAALEQARADCLAAAEDDAVALCYDVLCRALGAAAPQPEALRAHWQALYAGQSLAAGAVLHVHPQDAALLTASLARDGAAEEEASSMRWVADPEVALGGCIVRGSAGGLDARLESMLSACKSALLAARAAREKGLA
jgi:flagellar assembly protein FliH